MLRPLLTQGMTHQPGRHGILLIWCLEQLPAFGLKGILSTILAMRKLDASIDA